MLHDLLSGMTNGDWWTLIGILALIWFFLR